MEAPVQTGKPIIGFRVPTVRAAFSLAEVTDSFGRPLGHFLYRWTPAVEKMHFLDRRRGTEFSEDRSVKDRFTAEIGGFSQWEFRERRPTARWKNPLSVT